MSAVADYGYASLLQQKQPRVIRTEEQNEHYLQELEELSSQEDPSPAAKDLADLLTVLIEEFEERHYKLEPVDPICIVRELMAEHGLKQKDLLDVFGTASVASEVLNGKRPLALNHIKRLSKRFRVAPEVFLAA